jgi:hypothetical protein
MYKHNLFTYIKTDNESRNKMDRIVKSLDAHIDLTQWDEAADRGQLISKVAAKITRIRQKLLEQVRIIGPKSAY